MLAIRILPHGFFELPTRVAEHGIWKRIDNYGESIRLFPREERRRLLE